MRISTRGRYALRFMADLAQCCVSGDKNVALKDISARQDISIKYLEQIVSRLCKNGLVISSRGPQGGYRLAKPAEEYTIGAILRAIEGSMAPVACLADAENRCERRDSCSTLRFWTGLDEVINQYVDSVTLADLISQDGCPTDLSGECHTD